MDDDLRHEFDCCGWHFSSFAHGTLASEAFKRDNADVMYPTMAFPDNSISISKGAFQLHIDSMSLLRSVNKEEWTFKPNLKHLFKPDSKTINYELLSDTTQPIMHYAKVLMFEDEVDDRGQITVTGQLRVMPYGFLLLLRYHFKLDSEPEAHQCDYRFYHEFASQEVILEHNDQGSISSYSCHLS